MAAKQSQLPSYPAQKRRMRARSRAFKRLADLHRPEFLRLLHEEQAFLEAEDATKLAAVPVMTVREATRWDDPTLAYAGLPFSRPDREAS